MTYGNVVPVLRSNYLLIQTLTPSIKHVRNARLSRGTLAKKQRLRKRHTAIMAVVKKFISVKAAVTNSEKHLLFLFWLHPLPPVARAVVLQEVAAVVEVGAVEVPAVVEQVVVGKSSHLFFIVSQSKCAYGVPSMILLCSLTTVSSVINNY